MSPRLLLGGVALAALAGCSDSSISFGNTGTGGGTTTLSCPSGTTSSNGTTCNILNGIARQSLTLTAADSPYTITERFEVGIDTGADGTKAGGVPATVTIEPGVEIRGNNNSSYFLVNRGSRIVANGTADAPIVFTSTAAATQGIKSRGQWGGIVILGQAPTNNCDSGLVAQGSAACEQTVEGITDPRLFGGTQTGDDSGSLTFVQVRYAGFEVVSGSGNELNGITFGGVGNGTTLNHIQIHRNSDDGIEFFGGTANARNLVMTEIGDDSLDLDTGYVGNIQFVLSINGADGGDNLFELSGANSGTLDSSAVAQTNPTISNFTAIGGAKQGGFGIRMNSGFIGQFYNGVLITTENGRPCFRWQDAGNDDNQRATSGTLAEESAYEPAEDPFFRSVAFSCASLTDASSTANGIAVAPPAVADASNVGTGTSNVAGYTATLSTTAGDFVNGAGAGEEGTIASTALPGSFPTTGGFGDVGYIGAVAPGDDWFNFACGIGTTGAC